MSAPALQIGSVQLDVPVMLAPLAAISTPAFRRLCEAQGAGLTWTEMVPVPGLVREMPKIVALLRRSSPDRPYAVQLVSARPEELGRAVELTVEAGAELIDLNMGCPMRKVLKTGAGVGLMRTPELAEELVQIAHRSAAGRAAITVKMRLGWNAEEQNAPELARRLVGAGARAVTVHGRTKTQGYTGTVQLPGIACVVEAVASEDPAVPVIGNGDVVDGDSYRRMRQETGCAGVMIGRAALGNPWVFATLAAAARGESAPSPPSTADRVAVMRTHLADYVDETHEAAALREMRKHLIWYSRSIRGAATFRAALQHVTTLAAAEAAIDALEAAAAEAP